MRYAVGVGGNLGDVPAAAVRAEALLAPAIAVERRTPFQRTPALRLPGAPPQPDYWNALWIVATALGPHSLLDQLLAAERACGRTRVARWAPRTLDLDLIMAEDGRACATAALTLPHPRWRERPFVAGPLRELVPEWLRAGAGTG